MNECHRIGGEQLDFKRAIALRGTLLIHGTYVRERPREACCSVFAGRSFRKRFGFFDRSLPLTRRQQDAARLPRATMRPCETLSQRGRLVSTR